MNQLFDQVGSKDDYRFVLVRESLISIVKTFMSLMLLPLPVNVQNLRQNCKIVKKDNFPRNWIGWTFRTRPHFEEKSRRLTQKRPITSLISAQIEEMISYRRENDRKLEISGHELNRKRKNEKRANIWDRQVWVPRGGAQTGLPSLTVQGLMSDPL